MPVSKENPFEKEATTLADRLLQRVDSREYSDEPVRAAIETADVEGTADRFSAMLRLSQRWNERIPCLDFGEDRKAPIDFLPQSPSPSFFDHHPYPFPFIWEHFEGSFGDKNKLILVKSEEAKSFFRGGLIDFLSSRFRFAAKSSAAAPSRGLPFTVHTKHSGYRVHYTFAYLINTSPVFGAPTTPVSAYMKPGIWKFGIWQNGRVALDPADFDVPAVSEAHLVV
jgi:hypothetical protein